MYINIRVLKGEDLSYSFIGKANSSGVSEMAWLRFWHGKEFIVVYAW